MDNRDEIISVPYPLFGGTNDSDYLVLALDFGTTFSGIAYALTSDPDEIHSVYSWPGVNGRDFPKVPTVVQYGPESNARIKWGYQLDQTLEEKIIGLKLLFDPNQKYPYTIPNDLKTDIDSLPKPVDEIAADYIRCIFEHALNEIKNAYMDEFIMDLKKKYILTVPAIWSDAAKAKLGRAARRAGISPADMITEPEAAALYTLKTMKDKGLKDGDTIVICDAGGGTVDLISYEILSLNPFIVEALTIPSGGAYGSLMLTRAFEDHVRQTVGDSVFAGLRKTPAYHSAVREFEVLHKPSFNGLDQSDKYINFPMANLRDDREKGLINNTIILTRKFMFYMFDPIIQRIEALVSDQVRDAQIERLRKGRRGNPAVKAVFLVGGFGTSPYLRERIQSSNTEIMIVQPNEAWSAVAKGAVMSKLPAVPRRPRIVSAKAAKHYGTVYHSNWEGLRDKGQTKRQYKYWAGDRCDLMRWLIYKEDELARGKKNAFELTQKFPGHNPQPRDLRIEHELFESVTDFPSTHPNKNTSINCRLVVDLSSIPKESLKLKELDGDPYCQVTFSLLLENLPSGLMRFSIRIDGKEYSAVEAKY